MERRQVDPMAARRVGRIRNLRHIQRRWVDRMARHRVAGRVQRPHRDLLRNRIRRPRRTRLAAAVVKADTSRANLTPDH